MSPFQTAWHSEQPTLINKAHKQQGRRVQCPKGVLEQKYIIILKCVRTTEVSSLNEERPPELVKLSGLTWFGFSALFQTGAQTRLPQ